MTKSKAKSPREVAYPAPNKAADLTTNGRDLSALGVRLCAPEPLTPQQIMDACEEEIRELAYSKWEAAGCPSGDGFDFWLEAELEVIAARTGISIRHA